MRKFYAVMLLLLIIGLTACVNNNNDTNPSPAGETPLQTDADSSYKMISAEEAYQIMQDTDEYILLDVRTQEEFEEKRIEGAILIPYDEIGDRAETELPNKDAVILIYCRSGNRSKIAAAELCEMGYTNIYEFGGINDWPYETVSG